MIYLGRKKKFVQIVELVDGGSALFSSICTVI